MRLRIEQLANHLQQQFAPVYLLSGDEPLQMQEAADAIRHAARQQGYSERVVLDQGSGFDWSSLNSAADTLSLFSEKRLLELRLSSGKVGAEGGRSLSAYCERPAVDTLLLITLPKLERSQTNSKWYQAVDRLGVVVQIWPVEGGRLIPWIEQRLRDAGLVPESGVVEMLADRVEGNLLAANQEIEKLLLLYGEGVISAEKLIEAVADSARFDIFTLVDTLLAGDIVKGIRILQGLKAEGIAAPVVLWALSREIRLLAEMGFELGGGKPLERIMVEHRVWDRRKPILRKALRRRADHWQRLLVDCSHADRAIKGLDAADPWLLFQQLARGMAGSPRM
ncbi:MAG: DNA polymerase III subunit delta [gamma proteobacterium symbiont of Ctena orbiculata]|uniref:DNA polymerase III subunit delta n=1 Tax=Candidatus Thiodiazotropha taylori TaxID=2792791 RepID=A0A944MB53_9GAMM|nr:DNA polymerase III subunit delta [Candidatus Thiodiazotropha taylori]PVV09615.1 MAG: DNA polymerase III subunit delta [gamma proteobacterium symbiont of Ctena orbiculata]MBT2989499.1 DNA polymerase III subunit delta [Candidatus Thiodiazotropha taylori]MBT2997079.1 DNA polymerase III subunit delta [Candidatus Thiodiazotropha taylori]MBT3001233.1 DNA polymerase III subunit delta [Candidatus Thiodiazotropha taylori]